MDPFACDCFEIKRRFLATLMHSNYETRQRAFHFSAPGFISHSRIISACAEQRYQSVRSEPFRLFRWAGWRQLICSRCHAGQIVGSNFQSRMMPITQPLAQGVFFLHIFVYWPCCEGRIMKRCVEWPLMWILCMPILMTVSGSLTNMPDRYRTPSKAVNTERNFIKACCFPSVLFFDRPVFTIWFFPGPVYFFCQNGQQLFWGCF